MLSCCAQDVYPYHLHNVVSNDGLYGADPKFINEINDLATGIVEDVLVALKLMSEKPKTQATIALELFERVACKSDLDDGKLFSLAVNLWHLSIKNRQMVDTRIYAKMIQHLEAVKTVTRNRNHMQNLNELINRIKVKL